MGTVQRLRPMSKNEDVLTAKDLCNAIMVIKRAHEKFVSINRLTGARQLAVAFDYAARAAEDYMVDIKRELGI